MNKTSKKYTSRIFDKNQPKEIQVDNKLCLFTYIHVVAKKTFTHFSALLNGLEESYQFSNNTIGKEKNKHTHGERERDKIIANGFFTYLTHENLSLPLLNSCTILH